MSAATSPTLAPPSTASASLTPISSRLWSLPFSHSLLFTANNNSNVVSITGYSGPGGNLTIPGLPVSIIGPGVFEFNPKLTNVTIPDNITQIGSFAFEGCVNLSNVTFANGLGNIGANAFSGCTNLTSVTIPATVTNIGSQAFSGCSRLTAINVDPQNLFYSSANGVLFDKNQTTLIQYPGGLGGSYTIPDTVTNIGANAFIHNVEPDRSHHSQKRHHP